MPKKKPIDKRLKHLFEDAKPEQMPAEFKPVSPKRAASEEKSIQHSEINPIKRVRQPVEMASQVSQQESAMSLAFQAGQNTWATLQVLDESEQRTWSQDEQLLVKQVADQLSLALENARLFQETQTRAEELSVLNEMGRELSTKLDTLAIAEVVYRYTSRLMDTSNFFVALYDQKKEEKSYPLAFEEGQRIQLSPSKLGNRGFSDYIIRNKRAVFAPNDVLKHMESLGIEFIALNEDETPSQSWLGVPLMIGERVLGLISVQSVQRPNLYNEHNRDILTTIASQAAIAIENARLFQEAQRRAQETTILAEVGREISVTLDLETVLAKIATYARDLFQVESSAVYLQAPDGMDEWRAISVIGADAEEIKNDAIHTGQGILGKIILQKAGQTVNDANNQPEAITIQGTVERPFEHIMGVPILSADKVTGLMSVWRAGQGKEFTTAELEFLTSLARQAAIAVQNASLFQETQKSEAELRALFASMNDVIIVYDKEGRYVRIAPTNPSLLIRPPDEMIGRYIKEILPLELHSQFMETIHEALSSNETIRIEYPLNIAGNNLWFDANVSKLNEDQVFWVARDITDRKFNELTQIAITQISESVLSSKTMDELFQSIHEAIKPLLPVNNLYIAQHDPKTNWITFPYHLDEIDEDWSPRKLGRGLTSYVIRTGKPLRTTPEIFADLEAAGEVASDGARSVDWLGVPLRSKQVVSGVIAIQSYDPRTRITEQHKEILSIIATQVSSAIERFLAEREIQKFKLGIDRSDNAVFITDLEGVIQYANPAFEKVYGFSPEEAIGKTPRIFKSGLIPDEQYKHFWETLLSGGTVSGEITNKTKDGTLIPIEGTNSPILDESGKTIGFLAVHQDITERKLSEEILKRRNDYLAASSEIGRLVTSTLDLNTIFTRTVNLISERFGFYYAAIYIIEETGFNVVLREAIGEAGEKMKAQRYAVVVGSNSIIGKVAESIEPRLVNDTDIEPLYVPNPFLLDTRAEVAIPLRIGSRSVGVIDIQSTQAYAFTKDDLSVLQSLADQVAVAIDNARSYELSQQLIKDLREVDQLKSQFLANMSHELRTPLNSIIGFSRVILKGIDGPVSDMQQQDLTAIYNSGQHLLGLINDILDLARIEAGKMELNFEEVHLSEMATSVMSTAKGLVKEKPIQLIQRIPANMPSVRGDMMRVRQVLLNLISNASKFTDEGSITVEAIVQRSPTGKMEALINVIDTGPGISIEDQKKLFQAFSQVDGSATRKSGGSGLGLSICANLVQLHGGRIGIHSGAGTGSTFWFTLPLYYQPEQEIPEGKKVVLAIDDDPQVIGLYERYLNPQGYYVIPLTDPAKAKEQVLKIKPYAITLDIMMPNRDGWSVLTDLKSDPATRDYPVIICSIMEQADKGFSLGAADYLVKPILEEDLVCALDRLNKDGTIHEVLVIDDDPNDLRLIEKILNQHGQYKPILAEGGRKGWETIIKKTPHAIILDLFMPEMDGFTILEKLRENSVLRDIPVLVVSGGGLTNEQQQQLNDFGQRLITKGSLNEDQLIKNIESALKRLGA
ncbi:MAG TPA: GAF domain-containing protein [Anaerolineales bacterium]